MSNEKAESKESDAVSIDAFEENTSDVSELSDAGKTSIEHVPAKEDKPRGYQSYDEWVKAGKDPDEFKGKKAYEKESERFEALIRSQREIKELKAMTDKMYVMQQKIEEASYKKAKEELKAQALAATRVGDVETVNSVTDKLIELEGSKPNISTQQVKDVDPAVTSFIERNKWYLQPSDENDDVKVAFANREDNKIAKEYEAKGIKLTPSQHLEILQERIDNRFTKKAAAPTILPETAGDVGKSPTEMRALMDKVPAEHKKIMRELSKRRPMSVADVKAYVNRLKLTGEIK